MKWITLNEGLREVSPRQVGLFRNGLLVASYSFYESKRMVNVCLHDEGNTKAVASYTVDSEATARRLCLELKGAQPRPIRRFWDWLLA